MSKIYKYNGKILRQDNKIANSENCCCNNCGDVHCSDLPDNFTSNITFTAPYLLQAYLPISLPFNKISGGNPMIWAANSVFTADGCPNITIAFTYYCNPTNDTTNYDVDVTADTAFNISLANGDISVSSSVAGVQFDSNCDIIIPNFEITINDNTFLSFLFLDYMGDCAD